MARSMGTYNTLVNNAGTAAGYADFGARQSAVIRTAMARSADTGQVNWATVTTMPGTGVRDYEVYAFTDTLQSTRPIYVRIDYGGNPSAIPLMQVWVGTATNGAGTLSGLQLGQALGGTSGVSTLNTGATKQLYAFGSTATSVPRYCYASSDGSYLLFLTNFQQPNLAGTTADSLGGFLVERTRDADGTPNGNGYLLWTWNALADNLAAGTATSFQGVQLRSYDLSQPNTYNAATGFDYAAAIPGGVGTTAAVSPGGPVQAFPCYGAAPQPQGASKALLLAYTGDLPRMAPVTLTHYGQPTQWISCGAGQPVIAPFMSSPTAAASRAGVSLMFRWE